MSSPWTAIRDSLGKAITLGQQPMASSLPVAPAAAAAATPTSVAASATPVTLFAANALRAGGAVYNDSASALYLLLGAGASTTQFTYKLDPTGGYYELPSPIYRGIVSGVWDTATGAARCTELT